MAGAPAGTQRLDVWLWRARLFASRRQASLACQSGHIRLNRQPVTRAHQPVRAGDVVTFVQGGVRGGGAWRPGRPRVVRVLALAPRRGPAQAARALYADLLDRGRPDTGRLERPARPPCAAATARPTPYPEQP
ncbi:MAG: RNA-binding S4 domain-containing protein [Alphaproteobacteria bacterium]